MNSVDYSTEQHFVQSFIRKNRRERLLYELTTPEKRYDGVSRFCHQAQDFLDPAKIVMEGEDLERRSEFERFARQHDEPCFVLSPDFWLDEQETVLACSLALFNAGSSMAARIAIIAITTRSSINVKR